MGDDVLGCFLELAHGIRPPMTVMDSAMSSAFVGAVLAAIGRARPSPRHRGVRRRDASAAHQASGRAWNRSSDAEAPGT
jgi:hypothetical protein